MFTLVNDLSVAQFVVNSVTINVDVTVTSNDTDTCVV